MNKNPTTSLIKNNDDGLTTVFFSYSRVDQAQALPIIKIIEDLGYAVWWDGMLDGGSSFLETTEEALESAQAVVVLWSKTSISSHWVRDEATSGRVRGRLIPLSLDGTLPPLGFRQVQMISLEDWQGQADAPEITELKRVLAQMHGQSFEAQLPASAQPGPVKTGLSRRHLFAGAAGLAAITTGGIFLSRERLFSPNISDNSIAVLPFENVSGNAEFDYVASGLSSEIRNSLAQNPALRVVARSSSIAAVNTAMNAKDIGRQLQVANILEGSANLIGDQLKINVSLIETATGFSRWVKSFEHLADQALTFHGDIVGAILETFSGGSGGTNIGFTAQTENPAAFNAYLKAQNLIFSALDMETIQSALIQYNLAISLDPKFSSAYASRAQVLLWLGMNSTDVDTAQGYLNEAVNSAETAVDLSPDYGDAHSILGYILYIARLDMRGATAPYEQARRLGAGDAGTLARYASFMAAMARHDEARNSIDKAKTLDPLNPTIHEIVGLTHYASGRYEDAISAYQMVLNLSPDRFNAQARIGASHLALGRIADGMEFCTAEPNPLERLTCLAIAEHSLGNPDAAQAHFNELVETYGDSAAYQRAQVFAQWGELDRAVQELEKAYSLTDTGLTLLKIDPFMTPLHQNAAYRDLLVKIGFEV